MTPLLLLYPEEHSSSDICSRKEFCLLCLLRRNITERMKAAAKKDTSSIAAEEANATPLRSYLNQMGEMQQESFSKLLETTVDASCLPSCELNGIENQLDVLMVCCSCIEGCVYRGNQTLVYCAIL